MQINSNHATAIYSDLFRFIRCYYQCVDYQYIDGTIVLPASVRSCVLYGKEQDGCTMIKVIIGVFETLDCCKLNWSVSIANIILSEHARNIKNRQVCYHRETVLKVCH